MVRLAGISSPRLWLAAVAVLYFAVQMAVVRDLPLGWDEAIYASQTDPRRPTLPFSAPRARGTSWLVAPLQRLTGSTVALRIYLAALSSLALYGAYAVWIRLRLPARGAVPLAALLLVPLWTMVFYGPTPMPNVWVALTGVYATGVLLFMASGDHPAWLAWASAAAVAAATTMRPGDVAPLLMALGIAVLLQRRWRAQAVRLLAPLVSGAALGALPWVVEAQLRYDGFIARARRAAQGQSTGERFVPDYQLRALDGPILCRPCPRDSQPIPPLGVALWLVGAALVVLAVCVALRSRSGTGPPDLRPGTLLPTFAGGSVAMPYLFLVGYAAPRFLLPAYALLAIPASMALWHIAVRPGHGVRWPAALFTGALVVGHVAVQYDWLAEIMRGQERSRAGWGALAEAMHENGVRPPCTLTGDMAPPIA
jgi:hypothetical protein